MRVLSKICALLSWVLFVISLFTQLLLILTLWMPPFFSDMFGKTATVNLVNQRTLPFVAVGTLLFVAGFLLFAFFKRGKWIWLWVVTALIGALILGGVGLYLRQQYPETILSGDITAGYNSMFKLVWRHMLPLVVSLLTLLSGVFRTMAENRELREEALREIASRGTTPRFDQ